MLDLIQARSAVDANGCWLWQWAVRASSGYAAMTVRGKSVNVHRLAYEAHYGTIPPGMCVCHKCDVRHCVNPAHLYVGTHADNARDRDRRGRASCRQGELAAMVKLTEADVLEIRASCESQDTLARRYGVNQSAISRAKTGKSWGHL